MYLPAPNQTKNRAFHSQLSSFIRTSGQATPMFIPVPCSALWRKFSLIISSAPYLTSLSVLVVYISPSPFYRKSYPRPSLVIIAYSITLCWWVYDQKVGKNETEAIVSKSEAKGQRGLQLALFVFRIQLQREGHKCEDVNRRPCSFDSCILPYLLAVTCSFRFIWSQIRERRGDDSIYREETLGLKCRYR